MTPLSNCRNSPKDPFPCRLLPLTSRPFKLKLPQISTTSICLNSTLRSISMHHSISASRWHSHLSSLHYSMTCLFHRPPIPTTLCHRNRLKTLLPSRPFLNLRINRCPSTIPPHPRLSNLFNLELWTTATKEWTKTMKIHLLFHSGESLATNPNAISLQFLVHFLFLGDLLTHLPVQRTRTFGSLRNVGRNWCPIHCLIVVTL